MKSVCAWNGSFDGNSSGRRMRISMFRCTHTHSRMYQVLLRWSERVWNARKNDRILNMCEVVLKTDRFVIYMIDLWPEEVNRTEIYFQCFFFSSYASSFKSNSVNSRMKLMMMMMLKSASKRQIQYVLLIFQKEKKHTHGKRSILPPFAGSEIVYRFRWFFEHPKRFRMNVMGQSMSGPPNHYIPI